MTDQGKEQQVQQLTLRIPKELHESLRTLAFATDTSANDLAIRALADFLASAGHQEAVEAFLVQARDRYRVALDKLADL